MLRLDLKPEPPEFEVLVRTPGRRYLRTVPRPNSKQFRSKNYWTKILGQLHDAYGGICAYSCHWIPFDTGADTVEHFKPKSRYPELAYEWANYRLVCQILNGRKGAGTILDPFAIGNGWFTIDFPSLLVRPLASLSARRKQLIRDTCDMLGLNDDATCLRSRARFVKDYCQAHIDFVHLQENAPFLASEIDRQGLRATLNLIMGY